MSPSAHFDDGGGMRDRNVRRLCCRFVIDAGCFTDRLGEGDEVVMVRLMGVVEWQTDHFPASGHREAGGVLLTEIVRTGLSAKRERAENCGGIGIGKRQGRHRPTRTARSGALSPPHLREISASRRPDAGGATVPTRAAAD